MRPGIATCERPPLTPYHFISQRHSASIVQYTLYRRALHFASCQLPPRQQILEVLGSYRLHSPCCVPLQCAHCVVNVAEQPGYVLLLCATRIFGDQETEAPAQVPSFLLPWFVGHAQRGLPPLTLFSYQESEYLIVLCLHCQRQAHRE